MTKLSPRIEAKADQLPVAELPATEAMMYQSEISADEYTELMLGTLREKARDGVDYAIWAVEVMVRLHALWAEATDQLEKIRDVLEE